jgi:hypothetical protein
LRPGWPEDGLLVSSSGYGSYNTQAVADDAGGLYVAWHHYVGDYRFDVLAQHLDPEGRFLFPAGAVATSEAEASVDFVQAIADGRGGAIMAWAARRSSFGGNDVFARHLSGSGEASHAIGPRGTPMSEAAGDQVAVQAASDGAGGVYAVWVDLRTDPLGDIYAQWAPASSFLPPSPPAPPPLRPQLSAPYPNPTSGAVTVQLGLPAPERVEAAVFDARGARAGMLVGGQVLPGGVTPLVWDGRDDGGRLLPPGIYLLEVRAGDVRMSRRIVRTP